MSLDGKHFRDGKTHIRRMGNILSGVGAVVHEQELNVLGVVDEEGLVARRHHVLGLLVAAISNLYFQRPDRQHLSLIISNG